MLRKMPDKTKRSLTILSVEEGFIGREIILFVKNALAAALGDKYNINQNVAELYVAKFKNNFETTSYLWDIVVIPEKHLKDKDLDLKNFLLKKGFKQVFFATAVIHEVIVFSKYPL